MDINEIIIRKTEEFREKVYSKTESEKSLFHYRTVLNISQEIILQKDPKSNSLKIELINYFNELEKNHYVIDSKLISSKLHKHLLPIVQHLILKNKFITNGYLHLFILIGIVLDFILFYFLDQYYYPIFILLFLVLGLYRRKQAKRNGKYAAMFW